MAFLDLDGLKTFLSGCDNRYAPKSHSHTQYLNMNESRTANTVLAGPNGSAGVATFRKLVANDIPSISKSKISDFPSSMPASDVYSWAKASSKPSYSFSEIGGKVNASTQLTGTVPSSCLPSYVDDVLEYNGLANFPKTGESGKIYTDTSTNKVYRWGGSSYVVISDTITLGTTSSTAYRGDLGNEAHSWASTAKAHADKHGSAFASGLYKITTNDAGHVTNATAVAKSDITALGIPGSDTHYTSNLIVGTSSSAVANSATANGTTFLNLVENGGVRNSHQIKGAGATTVSADENGVITITSTDTKTTDTWRPCVDNLTSTATDQSLSANQGRILNNKFANYVPTSRTVNGKALTSNIVLTASDVNASAVGHTHSYAGSSTPGGPATSANQLNYYHSNEINFGGGKPQTCYINYRDADSDVSDGNSAIQYKFCNYSNDTTKTTIVASRFEGTATIADRVTGGNATADAARHVWFSDSSIEAARVSNDNFKYNPVGNIATCNISGNAASATHATSAGSATTATTATQLSSSAGSATNPIYFSNGKPTACTFSLNKTVPSNAVFTDTDTKNTAGATNTTSKIYLTGATTQAGSAQTYSNTNVWTKNGAVNALGVGNGTSYFAYVDGGSFVTMESTEIGFLKIKLPVAWSSTMVSFTVTIFNYQDGTSADYYISGYPYGTDKRWNSCTAVCVGKAGQKISNLTVRFGTDGTNSLVYIGESNTSWDYPQVVIHDVCIGFQGNTFDSWATGWSIDFTTTALTRAENVISNTHVGYGSATSWNNVSGKPSFSAVATSGSYNDLSNKPTIPSVGNGTVTITQNGVSKGSFTLNQSGNATIALTDTNTDTKYSAGAGLSLSGTTFSLASSGVTSGSYGPSSNVNGTNGTTISVPQITVDSYGRVTSIVNRTYTSVNTDTNTTYSAIPEATITALFN